MILTQHDRAQLERVRRQRMATEAFGRGEPSHRIPPYVENDYTRALRSDEGSPAISEAFGIDRAMVQMHRRMIRSNERAKREVAV